MGCGESVQALELRSPRALQPPRWFLLPDARGCHAGVLRLRPVAMMGFQTVNVYHRSQHATPSRFLVGRTELAKRQVFAGNDRCT